MTKKNIVCNNAELRSDEIYKIGEVFGLVNDDGTAELYMLAAIDYNQVTFVSLQNGNRWSSPIEVEDIHNVQREIIPSEFKNIKELNIQYTI